MGKETEFQVFLLEVASKELEKLPKEAQKQIKVQLRQLVDPKQVSSKKLKGAENTFRLRVGNYRVVYKIYNDEKTVIIIRIAHRKKVYR